MTEEEAKTKWCPYARVLDGQITETVAAAASVNRGLTEAGDKYTRCIGSDCMAWRERYDEGVGFPPTGGYCGLAGKP